MFTKRSFAILGVSAMLMGALPFSAASAAQQSVSTQQGQQQGQAVSAHIEKMASSADPAAISAMWASRVGKADIVLIATNEAYADALASGGLQGVFDAPLLFVDSNSLDDTTVKTIKKLGATKAFILGGTKAVSRNVENQLKSRAGLKVSRQLDGKSRVETSVKIAEMIGPGPDFHVMIARADDWADSLAAGALSAKNHMPIILTTDPGVVGHKRFTLHPEVEAYLKRNHISKVTVVGGSDAVKDEVVEAIKKIVPDTSRVKGGSRVETAVALAGQWKDATKKVTVIEGYNPSQTGFYNGFAAALPAALNDAPIVLANRGNVSDASKALLTADEGLLGFCGSFVNDPTCDDMGKLNNPNAVLKTINTDGSVVEETPQPGEEPETPSEGPLKAVAGDAHLFAKADNSAVRMYEIANLDDNVTYTVKLVQAKKNDSGEIVADLTSSGATKLLQKASITVANGTTVSGSTLDLKSQGGKISFTVSANQESFDGYFIPMVTMVKEGKPVTVASGDPVRISPAIMDNGFLSDVDSAGEWTVTSVDADMKIFTVKAPNSATMIRTVKWDDNDHVYAGTRSTGTKVTLQDFAKKLSVGDKLVAVSGATKATNDSAYYTTTSIPSELVWRNADPGVVEATKVSVTANHDTLDFKITDSELVKNLANGKVEVAYAPVSDPDVMAEWQEATKETLQETLQASDSPNTKKTFGYVYATKDTNDKIKFNGVEVQETGVGTGTGTDNTYTLTAVDEIPSANVKKAVMPNSSSNPVGEFTFSVSGLQENQLYAVAYRMHTASGEISDWAKVASVGDQTKSSDMTAAVLSRSSLSLTQDGSTMNPTLGVVQGNKHNANTDGALTNKMSEDFTADHRVAAVSVDLVKTTKAPVNTSVVNVERVNDPINNDGSQNSNRVLKFELSNDNFNAGAIHKDLIEVVASSGGKTLVDKAADDVHADCSTNLTGANCMDHLAGNPDKVGSNRVFYLHTNAALLDAPTDIEYTVKFKHGALETVNGNPSPAMEIKFTY